MSSKDACPRCGSELAPIKFAGIDGKICLKEKTFTTDQVMTAEQYSQVLEAYNKSMGLDKEHGFRMTTIGEGQMAATTVPEQDLTVRHKHCLNCGLNFHPPKAKPEEPFCSQACASKGWIKQIPPAGLRPAVTQPMPIIPARP